MREWFTLIRCVLGNYLDWYLQFILMVTINFNCIFNVAKCNLGEVKIKPISGRGSCTPIRHTGFRRASDDAYSLWEVVLFRVPNRAYVRQFAPPSSLVVAAALWVALDTCAPCSRLALRLAPPPAFIGTFAKFIYWR